MHQVMCPMLNALKLHGNPRIGIISPFFTKSSNRKPQRRICGSAWPGLTTCLSPNTSPQAGRCSWPPGHAGAFLDVATGQICTNHMAREPFVSPGKVRAQLQEDTAFNARLAEATKAQLCPPQGQSDAGAP